MAKTSFTFLCLDRAGKKSRPKNCHLFCLLRRNKSDYSISCFELNRTIKVFDCLKSEMTSTQAVSEALFDNCEDYQNIQNSSCKVKILLDVNDHPTITIIINITITMTITIPPQSQSPLTITTGLSSSAQTIQQLTRASRCGGLTDLHRNLERPRKNLTSQISLD